MAPLEQQEDSTIQSIKQSTQKAKNNSLLLIIILSILALGGVGFGLFGFLHENKDNQNGTPTILLNVDRNNDLGRKLFEQIQDLTARDSCGMNYNPLYELSDGQYIRKYEDLSNSTKFEIIAKRVPEIVALRQSGDKVTISGEKIEEVFSSIFGYNESLSYGVFGFSNYNPSEAAENRRVRISDYNIEQIDDNQYTISYEKEMLPSCAASRFSSFYKYVGLSKTINEQLPNNANDDKQKAIIVLEKKTIDHANEDEDGYNDGYYGVLFTKYKESYIWTGTYYLGNALEQ